MNAHTFNFQDATIVATQAFDELGKAESPLAGIPALCVALRALADTDDVENPAKGALYVLAGHIEALTTEAEHSRAAAWHSLHPLVFSR